MPKGGDRRAYLIKGARVLDPGRGLDVLADLFIQDGVIKQIGRDLKVPGAVAIDARGKVVLPGLVDVHVHLRDMGESHKETVASGTRAAARGGFTAVVNEPNTLPPLDSPEVLRGWKEILRKDAVVRVWTKVCITRARQGQVLAPFEELARDPLVVAATDDGNPVLSDTLMAEAMERAARAGLLLTPHCEDAPGLSPRGHRPYWSEPLYLERDLWLAERTGARVHISHVSMGESVELIRRAKQRGVQVSCEATPHHLTLDQRAEALGPDAKVNPPLRTPKDVEALRDALREGTIDLIASDHAPHTPQDKGRGWQEAPFGVVGLETSLGVIYTELVLRGVISLEEMVQLMSLKPAQVFGLPLKGLQVGQEADLVVFDPEASWRVDPAAFASKGRNTPFRGRELKGQVVATFVRGRPVVLEGRSVV